MDSESKWYNEYIKDIDLDKIEWIKLSPSELDTFFNNNYLDKTIWEYVCNTNASSVFPVLFGMSYLHFDCPLNNKTSSFLLGVVDNNIGKKTIIAATIYLDNYKMFVSQEVPATYISSMEINSFFRERGIFKDMCGELINFINPNQHVLTSCQSSMGTKCNAFQILKETLLSNGFKKSIFMDEHGFISPELRDALCSKKRVLKKTNQY